MIQEGGKRKVSRKSKKSRSKKSMRGGANVAEVAVAPVQAGGRRRKSRKSKKSMKGGAAVVQEGGKRRKSRKSKKSMKGGDATTTSVVAQEGGKRKSKSSKKSRKSMRGGDATTNVVEQAGGKRKSKKSKASKKSRRSASKKSKKSRRGANPQITVRGALVKYVWGHLDVKKVAADKGMAPIGVPAKIVQMVMVEAMKDHPMSEADKKSASYWGAVQKTAMKLLADNLQKYAGMVKK